MLKRRLLCAGLFCTVTSLMTACSTGNAPSPSPPVSPAKGSAADLRGNWLIAGSMPAGFSVGGIPFGLVLNLDIINGQVTGFGSFQLPCSTNGTSSGGVGGSIRLEPATVNTDGTFSLTDVLVGTNTQHGLVMAGAIPASPGALWSGTYTVSSPFGSCNGAPIPVQTGNFTTQKVTDLDGTFTGTSTPSSGAAPISLSTSLTQGGSTSLNGLSTRLNDQNVLNGTLQVGGSSCFKNGAVKVDASGLPDGGLTGNKFLSEFLMDDGSTVLLTGSESDTNVKTLAGVTLLVMGGGCDKTSALFTSVVKQ